MDIENYIPSYNNENQNNMMKAINNNNDADILDDPSSSSLTAETLMDSLLAMRNMESRYAICDYMSKVTEIMPNENKVDTECRLKMCEWSYAIVEHCHFHKETAAISTILLDMFLERVPWALTDKSAFQLAAITSLYTSIKIHETQSLAAETMSILSRDVFTVEQIEAMERMMLSANHYLLNPPTMLSFAYRLAKWVSTVDKRYPFETLLELTNMQLEAALFDYAFISVEQSVIAVAAVHNAMEGMAVAPEHEQAELLGNVCSVLQISIPSSVHWEDSPEDCLVRQVQIRLYEGLIGASSSSCGNRVWSSPSRPQSPTMEECEKPSSLAVSRRPISPKSVAA
jgi:hypothetical protein